MLTAGRAAHDIRLCSPFFFLLCAILLSLAKHLSNWIHPVWTPTPYFSQAHLGSIYNFHSEESFQDGPNYKDVGLGSVVMVAFSHSAKKALVLPQGACGLVGGAVLFHTLVFSQPMNVAAMEAQSTAIFLGPDG
jgi:hypothetical protein